MKAILLQDINSFGKIKVCYGRKGECLTVLNRRDDMLILKGSKENFPIHISKVKLV